MLSVVRYPAAVLSKASSPIAVFDEALRQLAREMNQVMISENGIGLAAPQIGKNIQLVIVNIGEEGDAFKAYVNPEITHLTSKNTAIEEGCLSLPGVYGYVTRAAKVHVRYQDLTGRKHRGKFRGMEAIVLQHEIDHLNGKLIIDRSMQITKGQHLLKGNGPIKK